MKPVFILTIVYECICSILNIMKMINSNTISNSQSFEVKPCAVAVNG